MLNGAPNDKDALCSAVRIAAREGAALRVVLSAGCSREAYERHLDFAMWEVRDRLQLVAPEITLETRVSEMDIQSRQAGSRATPLPAEMRS